jgi:hypothetical protein
MQFWMTFFWLRLNFETDAKIQFKKNGVDKYILKGVLSAQ